MNVFATSRIEGKMLEPDQNKIICTEPFQANKQANSVCFSDVVLVTHDKINNIIKIKNVQGFLVQWQDLNLKDND